MPGLELWNRSAIAQYFNIKDPYRLTSRKDFPSPCYRWGTGSLWHSAEVKLWGRLNDRVVVAESAWEGDEAADALAWWRRMYFMDAKRRAKMHLGLKADVKAASIFESNRLTLLDCADIESVIALRRKVMNAVGVEKGSFVRSYELLSSRILPPSLVA
jgi:hypothetical protein